MWRKRISMASRTKSNGRMLGENRSLDQGRPEEPEPQVMPLSDYIDKYYDGNKSRFAEDQGVTKQLVNHWIKAGYYVDDDWLCSTKKHRKLLEKQ